jgi:asparagine synthase (glutamine-hydrolysing)
MCGINGIITKNEDTALEDNIRKMNKCIIHRGPDDEGFYRDNEHSLVMAMRRLSIIDLSTGSQPVFSEDKKIILVFNGEIYNYQDLRNDLIDRGFNFYTDSDTEVILKLYEADGIASFNKLNGMFAFSLFDKKKDKLFIARDFFGEKPLYYTFNDDRFIWASELKSIVEVLPHQPEISRTGLNLYFSLTYIPAPFTIYSNIHKLEPNHYIELDLKEFDFSIEKIEEDFKEYPKLSKKECRDETERLVRKSVVSRSVADVPLGTFLSGGVDSSIVSLCLSQELHKKIDTFSIGFEKKSFDETDKSQLVAKLIDSNHHEFILKQKDLSENLSDIILNFDEPFADSSCLPTYLVSKMTRSHVKVALTGDGGDEVFGGYNKYFMGAMNNMYTKLIPGRVHNFLSNSTILTGKHDDRGMLFKARKLVKAINYGSDYYFNIISLGFQNTERSDLLKDSFLENEIFSSYKDQFKTKINSLNAYRKVDRLISLEGDLLVKVDRTSMLNSLECRAPFLNKELWNFSHQIPENYLLNKWDKKHILKESFKTYFPSGFLNKSKKGFGVPVGDWLRNELRQELEKYISDEFLTKQGIFKNIFVQNLVNNHLEGKVDNTFRVWSFYCFQKWYIVNYESH